jgi:ribosome-associated translation inhibitor RaiA
MNIQLNTDKNIEGHERLEAYIDTLIKAKMSRFNGHLTRIEVHLSDENGLKDGPSDKKCLLEARPKNMQAIVVTSQSSTIEKAIADTIDKLKNALESKIGKLQD